MRCALRNASGAGAIIGPYEYLKPAMDYLNKHFTDSTTIETVAAMVHLSTSQFQRLVSDGADLISAAAWDR